MSLPKGTTEFHIEQLKSLRCEIDEGKRDLRANERYVLLAVGAVWVFMRSDISAGNVPNDPVRIWVGSLAWLFSVILTILGCWRSYFIVKATRDIEAYIRQAEAFFGHPGLPGWETHREIFKGNFNMGTTAKVFWTALIAAALAVGPIAWYALHLGRR